MRGRGDACDKPSHLCQISATLVPTEQKKKRREICQGKFSG